MKLELIADSFYHKSTDPILKGEVNDFPERYLTDFPNTFKVYEEPEVKEDSVELVIEEPIEEVKEDLLDQDEPSDVFSDKRLPASAEILKPTLTDLARMNGADLQKIAPLYGLDPNGYETFKALRAALKEAI